MCDKELPFWAHPLTACAGLKIRGPQSAESHPLTACAVLQCANCGVAPDYCVRGIENPGFLRVRRHPLTACAVLQCANCGVAPDYCVRGSAMCANCGVAPDYCVRGSAMRELRSRTRLLRARFCNSILNCPLAQAVLTLLPFYFLLLPFYFPRDCAGIVAGGKKRAGRRVGRGADDEWVVAEQCVLCE